MQAQHSLDALVCFEFPLAHLPDQSTSPKAWQLLDLRGRASALYLPACLPPAQANCVTHVYPQ